MLFKNRTIIMQAIYLSVAINILLKTSLDVSGHAQLLRFPNQICHYWLVQHVLQSYFTCLRVASV